MLGKHNRTLMVFSFKLVESCPRIRLGRHASIFDLAHTLAAEPDNPAKLRLRQHCLFAQGSKPSGDGGFLFGSGVCLHRSILIMQAAR
jgi:hypothetical protein